MDTHYIDTHCHLNFQAFVGGEHKIFARAKEKGVLTCVIPGTDVPTSQKAVELARAHEGLYAVVGIHPHHVTAYMHDEAKKANQWLADIAQIQTLVKQESKVVGIGEVGLDRHTYSVSRHGPQIAISDELFALQETVFMEQVRLAVEAKKALVIHNREAATDLMRLIQENRSSFVSLENKVVLHCCEAETRLLDVAREYGFYIGVDGDATYDAAKMEFVKSVPMAMLVLETDAPYILPEPLRSQKKYPNTPATIPLIAEQVASLKEISVTEVAELTTSNAKKLFSLPE